MPCIREGVFARNNSLYSFDYIVYMADFFFAHKRRRYIWGHHHVKIYLVKEIINILFRLCSDCLQDALCACIICVADPSKLTQMNPLDLYSVTNKIVVKRTSHFFSCY